MLASAKKSSVELKIIFLSLAIVGIACFAFTSLRQQFVKLNQPAEKSFREVDAANLKLFESHTNPILKTDEKDVLRRKILIMDEQKWQYLDILVILYKNYYALLTLFPILTGLTGVLIFIILQNGWRNSNVYLKAVFMNLALLSSFTGVFPQVYQQSENISRYTDFYVRLSRMQKDIFDYNLTAPFVGKDSLGFNDFLIKLNDEEKNLIDLHLGLEQKEITKDIFEIRK